jgi:hypothetical protein
MKALMLTGLTLFTQPAPTEEERNTSPIRKAMREEIRRGKERKKRREIKSKK